MKKLILIALILTSTACSSVQYNSSTEYHPFNSNVSNNCAVESSTIYIINGVPSLKYICNN